VKVATYIRMSSAKQEASPAQQRKAISALLKANGYELVQEFSDLGVSGTSAAKRKGFQAMIGAAEAGDFERIVCYDRSRFGRFDSVEANAYIHRLREAGVTLETAIEGVADWQSFGGRVVDAVSSEMKAAYSRDVSHATLRGQTAKALAGRGYPGGKTPLGYTRETVLEGTARISTLKVDPTGAKVVRLIFREYLKPAGSLNAIARMLNEKAVPPARGGAEWRSNSIERILRNEVYVGDVVWGRRETGKFHTRQGDKIIPRTGKGRTMTGTPIIHRDAVPALVTREEFAEAGRLLEERKRYVGKPTAANPLAGLCLCQVCGSRLYSDGGGLLRCSGSGAEKAVRCSSARVRVGPLFDAVVTELTAFLTPRRMQAVERAIRAEADRRRAENPDGDRAALEARMRALEADIARGAERMAEVPDALLKPLQAALAKKAVERDEVDRRLRAVKAGRGSTAGLVRKALERLRNLKATFDAGDPKAINALLRGMGVEVVVGPMEGGKRTVLVRIAGGSGESDTTSQQTGQFPQLVFPSEMVFCVTAIPCQSV
jgi:DNA invertase Pin-like site-specific DNA recombinase